MESPITMDLDHLRSLISVEYSVPSHLGIREPGRYIQHIFGNLYLTNEQGERQKEVGSIKGYKVLLTEAINNQENFFDIFDMEEEVYALGETIFESFERLEFNSRIVDHYSDDFVGNDLLVLTDIKIDHEYRGNQLAKLFVKDFYNNFISGSQLLVVNFGTRANDKIMFYFSRMGFDLLPRFSNQLMFMNPAFVNIGFKEIVLD